MLDLPLARYRFEYEALDHGVMRAFSGSAWRGAFGGSLKRVVCAMRLRPCQGCPLLDGCAFPMIFDGHRPAGALQLKSYDKISVPYVFSSRSATDIAFQRGDRVTTLLTLIGGANDRFVYVMRAMGDAGLGGIGPARSRLDLRRVVALDGLDDEQGQIVYDGHDTCTAAPARTPPQPTLERVLTVNLISPLRLRLEADLVAPERFTAAHFIAAAVRRISTLAAFHTKEPIAADFAALKANYQLSGILRSSLRWQEQERFSMRQRQKMKMGGILGTFELDLGPGAAALFPWIALGQWVGAGKGASMGLGQYRLLPAAQG